MADARCRPRPQRSGRQGVDTDALRPQLRSHVACRGFESGLHRPHDVIVFNDLFRAEIGYGHAHAAGAHQRLGGAHHADEGVDRNVHGDGKALAGTIDNARMQILLRTKSDGIQADVELVPAPLDGVEKLRELRIVARIQSHDDVCFEAVRQRTHERLGFLALKGDGELGALRAERLGATKGDRISVGNPNDERFLAGERKHHAPLVRKSRRCSILTDLIATDMTLH